MLGLQIPRVFESDDQTRDALHNQTSKKFSLHTNLAFYEHKLTAEILKPNELASFLTSTRESQRTYFKADISCISLANKRLMDVTQLALTWVGWPNSEKLALTASEFNK